ncbi:MAG: M81 family metallopeptidase [Clostridiaceae bacterium]|nr:M81 family metallopeptidase [Clostridiaceae bacterium]
MRIFVGSIQQETNSFSPLRAAYEDFDCARGDAMLEKIAATRVFREAGAEIIPSIYAHALPSGRLSEDVFDRLLTELTDMLQKSLPVDGVWLYLHGALEVDGSPSFSGDRAITRAVREIVGTHVPVAVAMDFHANHDPAIVGDVNILRGYRTAPHADMPETQVRTAELLVRCIRERLLPCPMIVTIPAIVAGDMVITSNPPINALNTRLDEIERAPEMLTVSFFNGQNWVDSPRNHASAVAIALPGYEDKAAAYAREIADTFWDMRRDFRFLILALPPEEALIAAQNSPESTVFVTDSGDNTTAGAGGASAFFLRVALSLGTKSILFAGLYDPEAYNTCEKAGIGAEVTLYLGEERVPFTGKVIVLSEIDGWDGESAGMGALLRGKGVDVLVCERRCAFTTPEIIASGGADWTAYKIVVVKLGYLYPELAKIAPKAMLAKTPGASSVDIAHIPFTAVERPIWPLDEM